MAEDAWLIEVYGVGEYLFFGDEASAEEARRAKARWEAAVARKHRLERCELCGQIPLEDRDDLLRLAVLRRRRTGARLPEWIETVHLLDDSGKRSLCGVVAEDGWEWWRLSRGGWLEMLGDASEEEGTSNDG